MYYQKGTMMKKEKTIRFCVLVFACMLLCGVLSGCEVSDAALVLSLDESEEDIVSATQSRENESVATICVYVCGAVAEPGVVELPEGSRASDALMAAGGFATDAKEDYVNLAAKVKDGEKIYFPTLAEVEMWENESYMEQKGIVNINTADVAQLMSLPGIGEARAQDIIAYRETNGAFREKEDLKKVSGIKENMYQKLADKIAVE